MNDDIFCTTNIFLDYINKENEDASNNDKN